MTATFSELQALKQKRDAMLTRHEAEMHELEVEINKTMLDLDLGHYSPPGPSGGRRSLGHSRVKTEQWKAKRAEALKRGFVKKNGSPDVELLRLTITAEKLGISVLEVVQLEAKKAAARAAAKWSSARVGSDRRNLPGNDTEKEVA